MKVRANAETPADARMARSFGAEGIGLCRTEHMFFDGDRIVAMREMILADTRGGPPRGARASFCRCSGRISWICSRSWPACRSPSACSIRRCTNSCPRPRTRSPRSPTVMKVSADKLRQRTEALHEFNPMLGHRGCRLAVSYPEIAEMQARAIFEAAVGGRPRRPARRWCRRSWCRWSGWWRNSISSRRASTRWPRSVAAETGVHVDYLVGTMIELPRAALRAGAIAADGRVLLLRHQRPDPDHLRHLARRRRGVPRDLPAEGHYRAGSVRLARPRRRRRTGAHGGRARPRGPAEPEARHLRRAWRRPGLDPLLRGRSASTMSPARPFACRSRGWPPRRQHSRCRPDGRPKDDRGEGKPWRAASNSAPAACAAWSAS